MRNDDIVWYLPYASTFLGYLAIGPAGLVFGLTFGVLTVKYHGYLTAEKRYEDDYGEFGKALLTFTAAIIRTDLKVHNVELKYVQNFFVKQFGHQAGLGGIKILKKILRNKQDLNTAIIQFKKSASYPEKTHAIYFLFRLAASDKKLSGKKVSILEQISRGIEIKEKDFSTIKAMFIKAKEDNSTKKQEGRQSSHRKAKVSYVYNAYGVLGISSNSSVDEIKKAFRSMAVLHHPDKVAHLGEMHRKTAKEKFQEINQAYQYLQKKRGFK